MKHRHFHIILNPMLSALIKMQYHPGLAQNFI